MIVRNEYENNHQKAGSKTQIKHTVLLERQSSVLSVKLIITQIIPPVANAAIGSSKVWVSAMCRVVAINQARPSVCVLSRSCTFVILLNG